MTELTRTEAPWFFESDLTPDGSDYIIVTEDQRIIADLWLSGGNGATVSIVERKGNRHLIKAAPKLRKQLKAISVQIQMAGWTVPPGVWDALLEAEGLNPEEMP